MRKLNYHDFNALPGGKGGLLDLLSSDVAHTLDDSVAAFNQWLDDHRSVEVVQIESSGANLRVWYWS